LPLEFQKNINRYVEEKAIIFKKIDFFVVWIFLMLKRYDWLASFYVPLSEANRLDKQQILSLLKERTAKI
jgi:hypothetical protein